MRTKDLKMYESDIFAFTNQLYYGELYCSLLLILWITQQQLSRMARLKRKPVGNVPRLPTDIVAAIADEV